MRVHASATKLAASQRPDGRGARARQEATRRPEANALERQELANARKQIAAEFSGEIVLAEDLQTF
jgi:hypothetical protein